MLVVPHGRLCRARSRQRHPVGHDRRRQADGTLRRREDRRIPRHAAPAAGAARQEDRPHDPQHAIDRPWSQYFCCMISGNADYVNRYPVATKRVLRSILKAADLCVSDPQWVAQQMVDRGFVPQLRLRAANAAGHPVRPVAGLRSRRLAAVLRAAHAGDGHDQVESAKDHRQRHRLALPRRAEARAEDLIGQPASCALQGRERLMQIIQNRRRFLAGACGSRRRGPSSAAPSERSAEPPPETTSVRLRRSPRSRICQAPHVRGRGAAACRRLHRRSAS